MRNGDVAKIIEKVVFFISNEETSMKYDERNIICFHNPDEDNGYLSNWYMSDFEVDGIAFSSMEQYMMYMKAITFSDKESAEKIMAITDVAKIKEIGRDVSPFDKKIWDGLCQLIVYKGLVEKFRQNKDLEEKLLSTGDSVLAECAVSDIIWGIGISMYDSDRFDMSKWRGKGLLGFALMMVREELRHG